MSDTQAFIAEVEEFISVSGLSKTAFGIAAVGDPSFVRQLHEGRSPSLRTVERVRAFIAAKSCLLPKPDAAA